MQKGKCKYNPRKKEKKKRKNRRKTGEDEARNTEERTKKKRARFLRKRTRDFPRKRDQYIPSIPPCGAMGAGGSGISATRDSVVRSVAATLAAF